LTRNSALIALRLGVNFQSAEDVGAQEPAWTEMHEAQRIMIEMGRSLLFTARLRRLIPNLKAALTERLTRREVKALYERWDNEESNRAHYDQSECLRDPASL
jgi:hypothetical protein